MTRLLKTGHQIADTVSDLIGELPGDEYTIAYGILRGTREAFNKATQWFELDRGFWDADHFEGNYRMAYMDMQPQYSPESPKEKHSLRLEPWRKVSDGYVMICPPTDAVCSFYGISHIDWVWDAVNKCRGKNYKIRYKHTSEPLSFDGVSCVMTFNSAVGWQAIQRGIPCISSQDHSLVGSFCKAINAIDNYDRDELFNVMQAHQFKLSEKEKICGLISHYQST